MIRWIDSTLGTAPFEDPETQGFVKLDVRSLVDGPANSSESLLERIEAGLTFLRRYGRLVVCCDYGISRSNTIASAILARRDALPFNQALSLVQQRINEMRMDYGFVQTVRAALAEAALPALNPKCVLVTGGTGFLGQWLERVVEGDFELIRLGSKDLDLAGSPFALDEAVRIHRPVAIIHLANPRIYNTHEVVGESLSMVRNVADVCGEHGVFLVFPSGWVVFSGNKEDGDLMLKEDALPMPYGNYAMSKSLCEHLVNYLRQGCKLHACILRLTPIYGPGSNLPRFLFRMAEACREGKPLVTHLYSNGRPKLQLLHAEDAARSLLLAAERRIEGTFNIGGAESHSTHDLAKLIAEVLDTPASSQEIQLLAKVANITLDTSKARSVLGWEPKVDLKSSIARLLREER